MMKAASAAMSNGPSDDAAGADTLFGSLYAELHRLARRQLHRQGRIGGLGVTTLLHEAYLSISGQGRRGVRRSGPLHGLCGAGHARPDHRRRAAAAVAQARRAVRDYLAADRASPSSVMTRARCAISEALDELARGRTRPGRDRRSEVLLRLLVRRDCRRCAASPSGPSSAAGRRRACICTRRIADDEPDRVHA